MFSPPKPTAEKQTAKAETQDTQEDMLTLRSPSVCRLGWEDALRQWPHYVEIKTVQSQRLFRRFELAWELSRLKLPPHHKSWQKQTSHPDLMKRAFIAL